MALPSHKIRKIATLLISLGPDRATEILTHLNPAEVSQLVQEIAAVGKVSNQTKRAVLREFRARVSGEEAPVPAPRAASAPVGRARNASSAGPALLTTLTPERAAELIADEPLHIATLLLADVPRDTAARIIDCLPAELQPRMAVQLATAPARTPELRAQLEAAVRVKARRYLQDEELNGRAMLQTLSKRDAAPAAPAPAPVPAPAPAPAAEPDTTAALRTLAELDHDALHAVLNAAELSDVCLALRGAEETFRAACLRALPFRKRLTVQTALRSQQAIRLRDIADAQQRLLAAAPSSTREKELAHV